MQKKLNKVQTMKAIILVRVSTFLQTLEDQKNAVVAQAKKEGFEVPPAYIIEDVESGVLLTEEERNGLNKMKNLIEQDPDIKAVFVFELSRISRQVKVLFSIRDYLQEKKVQLYIMKPELRVFNDNWEVDIMANLMFSFLSVWAEYEGIERKARISRKVNALKAQGKKYGGRHLFGYTADSENNIIENPEESKIVKYIFSLYASGNLSYFLVAEELKKRGYKTRSGKYFGESGVEKIINNPEYYKRGLITEKTFNDCGKIAQKRAYKPKKDYANNVYMAKGIIIDGKVNENGNKESFIVNKGSNSYWLKSKNKCFNVNMVDDFLWEFTKMMIKINLQDPESYINEESRIKEEIGKLDKEIENRTSIINGEMKKLGRIEERYIEGSLSKEKLQSLEAKHKDNIAGENKKIEGCKDKKQELEVVLNNLDNNKNNTLSSLESIKNPQEKLKLIRENIESLEYISGGRGEGIFIIKLKPIGRCYTVKMVSASGKAGRKYYWVDLPWENERFIEIDWQKSVEMLLNG